MLYNAFDEESWYGSVAGGSRKWARISDMRSGSVAVVVAVRDDEIS